MEIRLRRLGDRGSTVKSGMWRHHSGGGRSPARDSGEASSRDGDGPSESRVESVCFTDQINNVSCFWYATTSLPDQRNNFTIIN